MLMDAAIDPHLKRLIQAGHQAASADNSQPWRFAYDRKYLYIQYDEQRSRDTTFPHDSPATLLSIGGVIENICRESSQSKGSFSLELFPRECPLHSCYAMFSLQEIDLLETPRETSVSGLRHTNRFPFKKDEIHAATLRDLTGLSQGTARITILKQREAVSRVADLVRSASQIRFQTREVHEWLGKSLRFSEASVNKADGLDVNTLDLPPGGGLFLKFISDWGHMQRLNRFGAYRLLARIDAKPIEQTPALVVVSAAAGEEDAIDAGRLINRAWCYLNSQGIAVHPYYVVADQLFRLEQGTVPKPLVAQVEKIRKESRAELKLAAGEVLYMLLRIGFPTREAPRSRRLPLEKVVTDLTATAPETAHPTS